MWPSLTIDRNTFTPTVPEVVSEPSPEILELSNTLVEFPKLALEIIKFTKYAYSRLPLTQQIEEYLNSCSAQHRAIVNYFAAHLPTLENSCRESICIPVMDAEEEKHIYNTLTALSNQRCTPNTFEIVLFLNHPFFNKEGESVLPDGTANEVMRFIEDHNKQNPKLEDQLRIRVFSAVLDYTHACIGEIRKILNDVVVVRCLERCKKEDIHDDLILVRMDADTKFVRPECLQSHRRFFERNPEMHACRGDLLFDISECLDDPLAMAALLVQNCWEHAERFVAEKIPAGGANFAVRTSAYCRAGGYEISDSIGEDVQLSVSLRLCGFSKDDRDVIGYAGPRSRLVTSSRRGLAAYYSPESFAPMLQWINKNTPFQTANSLIRNFTVPTLSQDFEAILNDSSFNSKLLRIINQSLWSANPNKVSIFDERIFRKIELIVSHGLGLTVQTDEFGRVIKILDDQKLKWRLRYIRECLQNNSLTTPCSTSA